MSETVHGEVTVVAATGSEDAEAALAAVAALRGLVEVLEALNVEHARAEGWPWEAIAQGGRRAARAPPAPLNRRARPLVLGLCESHTFGTADPDVSA